MEANEAPEKIILLADRYTQIIHDEWVINDYTDNIKIEYTRSDAFINKACKWLEKNKDNSLIKSEDTYLSGYLTNEFIDEFKQAMEGGEK